MRRIQKTGSYTRNREFCFQDKSRSKIVMVHTRPGSLRALEFSDYDAMSRRAADLVINGIRRKPDLLLCAAAGSTPTRTYQILAGKKLAEPRLFDQLRVVKLDEWGGLEMDHPATCETYLQKYLIGPLNVSRGRYIAFRSDSNDPRSECERIQTVLEKNGSIDVCILGLGLNGHLGMIEPAELLTPFVHVAKPAESSLRHPMLEPANRRIAYGLTLGIADILRGREVLLLVSGVHKQAQLRRLLTPAISTQFPASFLWLHPQVTVLYDRDSARSPSLEDRNAQVGVCA